MKKIIDTSAGQLEMSCNAATPLVCSNLFRINVLEFFEKIEDLDTSDRVEKMEKIAYIMNLQATKPLSETLNSRDGFLEWLAKFEFAEMTQKIIPEMMELWVETNKSTTESKNPASPR